jgi:hypothetical protein
MLAGSSKGETMSIKDGKQWYRLTDRQLSRLADQGNHPEAIPAWDLTRAIREIGGTPRIYYSEITGFRVIDEHDLEKQRLSLALEIKSRPFPGWPLAAGQPVSP